MWKALHGALGKKKSEKLPQSIIKTRLDTFENDFGHFWIFEIFWILFQNFRRPDPPFFFRGIFFRKNIHKTCSKQVWKFLGTILGFFAILNFFWFFRKLSMTPWNTEQKKFFKKIAPRHDLTLGNVFGHFWKFEIFWFFSWIFSKSLPQNLSPENFSQIFRFGNLNSYFWVRESQLKISSPENLKRNCVYWLWREYNKNVCWFLCRKNDLKFFGSGIWTHNFGSRKSGMGSRILTVAWVQKECLLIFVSENWSHIFRFGNLNSNF